MNDKMWKEIGSLDLVNWKLNFSLLAWSLWLSFGGNNQSRFFSFGLFLVILFNSLKESEPRVGVSKMFDSNVDFLLKLSLFNLFFNHDTNRSGINIEDFGSSSMVEFMRHALVDGSINNNVNIVSFLVLFEIIADSDCSMSSESFLELMLGSWSVSPGSSHVYKKFNFKNLILWKIVLNLMHWMIKTNQ